MRQADCRHKWAVANKRDGYLVIEGCFHCGGRISFFSEEPFPPREDYREGEHFWSFLGGYQATKFDLQCEHCNHLVPLDDVMALMLCTVCDPQCEVGRRAQQESGGRTWPYVALCADTSHAGGRCTSPEGIQALTEYYNSGLRGAAKKIVVVPCSLRRSPDTCQGIVLADVGLTEMY